MVRAPADPLARTSDTARTAKLAISIARKIGSLIFVIPEDLVRTARKPCDLLFDPSRRSSAGQNSSLRSAAHSWLGRTRSRVDSVSLCRLERDRTGIRVRKE
jgi:hypothetical protein